MRTNAAVALACVQNYITAKNVVGGVKSGTHKGSKTSVIYLNDRNDELRDSEEFKLCFILVNTPRGPSVKPVISAGLRQYFDPKSLMMETITAPTFVSKHAAYFFLFLSEISVSCLIMCTTSLQNIKALESSTSSHKLYSNKVMDDVLRIKKTLFVLCLMWFPWQGSSYPERQPQLT